MNNNERRRRRAIAGPELACYKVRLLYKASLIQPFRLPDVETPPLGPDELQM